MIAPRLAYVGLVVTDVVATATILERDFGLRRTECPVAGAGGTTPVFAVGSSALALFAPGDSFVGGQARPGVHHIALETADPKVPDINAALGRLARAGHSLIDTVGRPGSRRALIGFLHPRSLNGVLVHLVQRPAA